jgi:transposase-like protein
MPKKTKTTKKKKIVDPCPICSKELHLNHEYTQRVGLLDNYDEVVGWLCPHCRSEFNVDNQLVKFMGEDGTRGEA